ncbi:MAG TPA: hypothetical protein VK427_11660 [Kofleriaceae bacterium]|nr:hypothetical protein [Kofleriaceae bacterium]
MRLLALASVRLAGIAPLGRHLVWLVADPDAYAGIDHLGPVCP